MTSTMAANGTHELTLPLDVTVAGDPGRLRDDLVRTLTACMLVRVRVRVAGIVRAQPAGSPQAPVAPTGTSHGPAHTGRCADGGRARPGRPGLVVLRSAHPARDVRMQVAADGSVPVLVVSGESEESEIVRALQAGATSYLVDGQFTVTELLGAVLGTAAGHSHLSPAALAAVVHRLQRPDRTAVAAELAGALSRRERQIMELVAEGHPNSVIARQEFITEKTVRNHLNNIYAKLQVRSRAEAILVWWGRSLPSR